MVERVEGVFNLDEGQYIDSWIIGIHKTYEAFVQCKPLHGTRDGNKDSIADHTGKTYTDAQGVNIHRGHETWLSKYASYLLKIIKIDKYSMGCQVSAFADNLVKLLQYSKASGKKYFTYTLLGENDFK